MHNSKSMVTMVWIIFVLSLFSSTKGMAQFCWMPQLFKNSCHFVPLRAILTASAPQVKSVTGVFNLDLARSWESVVQIPQVGCGCFKSSRVFKDHSCLQELALHGSASAPRAVDTKMVSL